MKISKSKFTTGFTLVELLMVIAIVAIVFAFSTPYALNFYRSNLINDAQTNIVSTLERAKHYAILQKNDSNFGVHIDADSITLFQGDTYVVEDVNNEVIQLTAGITYSGPADIVFSKLTGTTATTSTTTITYGTLNKSILVEESGKISVITSAPQ